MTNITINADPDENLISGPEPHNKINFDNDSGFDLERAWELANLIRIAGQDFRHFNNWFNEPTSKAKNNILEEEGELEDRESRKCWIYVKKEITNSVIWEYDLLSDNQYKISQENNEFPDKDYFSYKILKTYEFESYYPHKLKVDIDRFGFIAKRDDNIFIVFRGTREPSEWFNNAQFQQINFLKSEKNPNGYKDCGQVSMGFNKMYTEFRPGLLFSRLEEESAKGINFKALFNKDNFKNKIVKRINKISKDLTSQAQEIIVKTKNARIDTKSISDAIDEFYFKIKDKSLDNTKIYIAGHSLGAALATIATMDLTLRICEEDSNNKVDSNKINNLIDLYTFASPRVGNNIFADKFNHFVKHEKIRAFRIINSEDLVTNIPFSVWFKAGLELDDFLFASITRSIFNEFTGGIFDKDYQHVGMPICFTHQARKERNGIRDLTATVGDNHNMTRTYCGALPS